MKLIFRILIILTYIFLPIFSVYTPASGLESSPIKVYLLKVRSVADSASELVVVYNNSDSDVQVNNLCVQYSPFTTSPESFSDKSCIEPENSYASEIWLKAESSMSFATDNFLVENTSFLRDFSLTSGLSNSSGRIRLYDKNSNSEIDRVVWGSESTPSVFPASVHVSSEVLARIMTNGILQDTDKSINDFYSRPVDAVIESGIYEVEIVPDTCTNIADYQAEIPEFMVAEDGICGVDSCENIDGLQITVPEGLADNLGSGVCSEIVLEDSTIYITELLPNSPGSDTGQEFIELYNPNARDVNLSGYKLQVGPSFNKVFEFGNVTLSPGEFRKFSDSETSIVLPNASGVALRLLSPAGNEVSASDIYTEADDDESWALVNDQWIYTNQITPNAVNKPYLIIAVNEEEALQSSSTIFAPCGEGKYRNSITNRCRNIELVVSRLVPCDEDEFRNPATNRCNKVSTKSALGDCPEGQSRNTDTNRCRNNILGTSTDDLPTISENIVETSAGSINWGIIALALGVTLGYMLYEWREELRQYLRHRKLQKT